MKRIAAFLAVLALTIGLAVAGSDSTVAKPASPTACTYHTNYYSALQYGLGNSHVYSSDGVGYPRFHRTVYSWDSCNGGYEYEEYFEQDCHMVVYAERVDPDGSTTTLRWWDNGHGCSVRGTLQFQQSGKIVVVTSYGNIIWSEPGHSGSSFFLWELRFIQGDQAGFYDNGGWVKIWSIALP
jgi:hypothetical protein